MKFSELESELRKYREKGHPHPKFVILSELNLMKLRKDLIHEGGTSFNINREIDMNNTILDMRIITAPVEGVIFGDTGELL